jgi:hypothetical protein
MATHTIRIIKGGRTLVRKQVTEGLGRDAVVVQAQPDVTYLLSDMLENTGPSKIAAKRVGKSLHIAIGKGNPDAPDLIIEGYFDYPPAPIAGNLAEGGQAVYDLGSVTAPASAASPATPTSAASGASASAGTVAQASLPSDGMDTTMWALAGLGGALALAGGGGGGGSGGGAEAATNTALAKVSAYAADGAQPAPSVTDYTDIGIRGVTDTNLAAINNAVDSLAATNVDSKAKLQTVVDAYTKILAEANGSAVDATPGSNPLASDYAAIGASVGLAATNTTALVLLNDVVSNLTTTAVDTVAEINAIATVVDKVMNSAAGTPAALTVADYALLGLATSGSGAVTTANLAAVNNALASAGGQASVDTFAELNGLVTAVATIVNYAEDKTQAVPTLAQYTAAGITGVSAANLAAINSAVDANAAAGVDTKAELQAVVDAYAVILAEANGAAADVTPGVNPTVAQYTAMGASVGLAASNAAALRLLNEVVGNLTTTAVDTVAEVNAIAAVVDKVMTSAAGIPATLTVADYALLGLATTGAGAVTATNLAAVNNAIASAGGQANVDSFAELNALVTAVATIVNFAEDKTQAVPILAQYTAAGITGVTAANLAAINSAVDANAALGVDTKAELQTIVDTYSLILAEANGVAPDATPGVNPTAAQFALIGANIGAAATNTVNLSLLDDAIARLTTISVDSVTEINDIAAAANAVMTGAAGGIAPTAVQLATLGIAGVTVNNLLALQNAIAATADSGLLVDTVQELQTVVTGAATAAAQGLTTIQNYASSSANITPVLADYVGLGVTGVDATNLAVINSAIDALIPANLDSPFRVQTTVDAYNKILAEANGAAVDATPGVNPTANDFAAIGASIGLASGGIATGTDLAAAALALLDDALAGLATAAVDTVSEVNALGAVVDKVMNLAKLPAGGGIPAGALTMADLALLGVDTSLADTAAESNAILQAIIDSADAGSAVNTILALQAIVNANSA